MSNYPQNLYVGECVNVCDQWNITICSHDLFLPIRMFANDVYKGPIDDISQIVYIWSKYKANCIIVRSTHFWYISS